MEQKTHTTTDFIREMESLIPWQEFAQHVVQAEDVTATVHDDAELLDIVQSIRFYCIKEWFNTSASETIQLIGAYQILQIFLQYNPKTDEPISEEDCAAFFEFIHKHGLHKKWHTYITQLLENSKLVIKKGKVSANTIDTIPTICVQNSSRKSTKIRLLFLYLPLIVLGTFALIAIIWHNSHLEKTVTVVNTELVTKEAELNKVDETLKIMEQQMTDLSKFPEDLEKVAEHNRIVHQYNITIEEFRRVQADYNSLAKEQAAAQREKLKEFFIIEFYHYLKEKYFGS